MSLLILLCYLYIVFIINIVPIYYYKYICNGKLYKIAIKKTNGNKSNCGTKVCKKYLKINKYI